MSLTAQGITKDEAELYFQLHEQVTPFFLNYGAKIQNIAGQILTVTLNTGLRLLRQNYLMFQYRPPSTMGCTQYHISRCL